MQPAGPSAARQLIIQPLNVNHTWQAASLCRARLLGLFTCTSAVAAAALPATVPGWLLIKEPGAEAQGGNSSEGKVTCNDDPSRRISKLSFQYPAP